MQVGRTNPHPRPGIGRRFTLGSLYHTIAFPAWAVAEFDDGGR